VELKDRFGHEALLRAMQLSLERKVLGADYVEQILLQLSHPSTDIPRLELRGRPELSHLSLSDVDLAAYDNALIRKGRGHEER
jgi:hypothetical protein